MPAALGDLLEGAGRLLIVVAHPDDEVLACGGLLCRRPDATIVHVTDGAPQDGADARRLGFADAGPYAAARRREAETALAIAGVPATQLTCLGWSDQEASLHLVGIARALAGRVAEADLVLTHAFEGGHGDHDAVAYAVSAALRLARHGATLMEMPFYHAGAEGWTRQRFLPLKGAGPETAIVLDPHDLDAKRRMMDAHRTQGETLRSFDLGIERYRRAPAHRFDVRPHAGALLYERHGWNLTWTQWSERVATADVALGLAA